MKGRKRLLAVVTIPERALAIYRGTSRLLHVSGLVVGEGPLLPARVLWIGVPDHLGSDRPEPIDIRVMNPKDRISGRSQDIAHVSADKIMHGAVRIELQWDRKALPPFRRRGRQEDLLLER
ncbi:hypothetical protein MA20_32955 [Bradyrhizobium japonicum]|uniref:Uncharacterized protein n=1 Tax=Bradyrhizobium japonicum TaxID=375 RepID=A0A0A3YNP9_BRAJP|nr:hypothetical protein MA20_32955 [Bradyrhizobium japonicum]